MKPELIKAEYIWKQLNKMDVTEKVFSPEALTIAVLQIPDGGWLKHCRKAQLIGLDQTAETMRISKQGVSKLETNEANKAITIESLEKAAEAMDCELVYFIRPRQKKAFSSLIWRRILPKALKTYRQRTSFRHSQKVNPAVLARIAQEIFRDPEVRREMGWVRNRDS